MADDDYEIMPQKVLSNLRKDIDELKRGPVGKSNQELKDSIEKLSASVESLMKIFKAATDEMKLEEAESSMIAKNLKPISDKLDELLEQNETIAAGIVALSDILNKHLVNKPKLTVPRPPAPQPTQPQPQPIQSSMLSNPPVQPGFGPPTGFSSVQWAPDTKDLDLGTEFLPSTPPRKKFRF